MDLTGRELGKYRLLTRIGAGGMGVVYKAHHPGLGADVAIKVLSHELATHDTAIARFRQETTIMARLQLPGVVPVLDSDVHEGVHYYVMPLLLDPTLDRELAQSEARGALYPLDRCLSVASSLLGRARRDPPGGDRAPRHQTGQPLRGRRGDGATGRFRHRARAGRHPPHRQWRRSGQPALDGARAAAGATGDVARELADLDSGAVRGLRLCAATAANAKSEPAPEAAQAVTQLLVYISLVDRGFFDAGGSTSAKWTW